MRHAKCSIDKQLARAAAEDPVRRRTRRIEAFVPDYRRFVRDLASSCCRIEDLADSFPALLFALATGYGTPAGREAAFAFIKAGAPLRQAADALGLPWWLRRLPAQAFTGPLGSVPSTPEFSERIAPFIPSQPDLAGPWLERVSYACEAGHADFALWTGRQLRGPKPLACERTFLELTAWAWHALHPDTPGHGLLRRPWEPSISTRRASEEVGAWRHRIALDLCLGAGLADTWLAEGSALGYEFVALRTAHDFIVEAEAMDNCLDQYAHRLECGTVRVFSVRRQDRIVADLEIAAHEHEFGMPMITQLKSARNRRAPLEVWQAAYAWLGGQSIRPAAADLALLGGGDRERRMIELWRPYLETLSVAHRRRFESVVLDIGKNGVRKRRQVGAGRSRIVRAGPLLGHLRGPAWRRGEMA
ncbi:MAG TPA: hypothetical protein VNK52_14780 [Hyphomicrobiaceae bacterium]|nr:hypothetical protein [Hyphomicrobiaceae bacterium]